MDYWNSNSTLGRAAIRVYTFGRWVDSIPLRLIRGLLRRVYWIIDFLVIGVAGGSELPATAKIGKNVSFPHFNGIFINARSEIGDNVLIFHQVTLGIRDEPRKAPTIGNNVLIGAGAKVLGPIHVGDGAIIGANAVVLEDVPAGATVVGVPARIVKTNSGRQHLNLG